jgi:hypothetical protein
MSPTRQHVTRSDKRKPRGNFPDFTHDQNVDREIGKGPFGAIN